MHRTCSALCAAVLQASFFTGKAVDLNHLHPSDIKVVLTLGDSISAAEAAFGAGFIEDRWLSFSGGKGQEDQRTMPYLLNKLGGANVNGASTGIQQQTTRFDYNAPDVENLNAAVCGSDSSDWEKQLDHLVEVYPKFVKNGAEASDWKLFTLFFGANDVCTHWEPCYTEEGTLEEAQERVADRFQQNIERALLKIIDVFHGNLYINLPALFDLGTVSLIQQSNWGCRLRLAIPWAFGYECKCIMSWRYPNGTIIDPFQTGPSLSATVRKLNHRLEKVAAKFDRYNGRNDIGVNFGEYMKDVQIPDIDFVSYGFDCFHPSALAHDRLGVGLWNSMLEVSGPQFNLSAPWFNQPLKATQNTRLVTYKDRQDRLAKQPFPERLRLHQVGDLSETDAQEPSHELHQSIYM
mmetsp:Transcript_88449/g.166698  ORF Transcript_88449/g.166698 Transcript_88449/m.166698 type:complete len:406 (-) Transcript_88449:30-1247(-)